MNRTCHSSFPGWADAVRAGGCNSGLCSTWAAGWDKRPAIWHLEQAVLSLERHHGVRAGRQLDCMVGCGVARTTPVWKVGASGGTRAAGVVVRTPSEEEEILLLPSHK
jgi:hypothetical protein